MADELLHLFSDIFSKWVLIMSGVGGIAISIWEHRKGSLGWRTFRHVSIWAVVVAVLYAWHREYQEKLSLLNSDVVVSRGPSSLVYEHEGSRNSEASIYIIVSDIGLTNRNVNPIVLAPTIRLFGRVGEAPLVESSEDDPLPSGLEEWLRSRSIGIGTRRLPVLINIDGRKSESGYVVFFIRKAAFLMWPEFQTKFLGQIGHLWLVFVDQLTGKNYPQMLFGTAIKVPPIPPQPPKRTKEEELLCPSPLKYSLHEVAAHGKDNFAFEIRIQKAMADMFRVRIYSKAFIDIANVTEPDGKDAVVVSGLRPGSNMVLLQSTKPTSHFGAVLYSTEAVRIVCVNQEN